MKNILLTGFAPFGGENTNPSWEAVQLIQDYQIQDVNTKQMYQVKTAQLSCEFGTSLHELYALIEQYQPEIVICAGQAGGRSDFSIERIAINIDDARISDNNGQQPIDQSVIKNAPTAYFSTLPIKSIMLALKNSGIPASISQSAGTFVCNHVFYGLMHYSNKHSFLQRSGFIHIPYLPSQACFQTNMPSMSLENMVKGLKIALETTVNSKIDAQFASGSIC
jgi:pyroglutamyl-peptidase